MTTAPFSAQDLALVALVAKGLDDAGIAAKASRTPSAIRSHIKRLTKRYASGNRAGLVAQACRAGQLPTAGGTVSGPLPPRLVAVLVEVAAGRTNPEIAVRLHLSVDGVKSRIRELLAWLGASGRAHAVGIAHWAGLLPEVTR
jgi:DNA-binding NarL/FixJ family response regulator